MVASVRVTASGSTSAAGSNTGATISSTAGDILIAYCVETGDKSSRVDPVVTDAAGVGVWIKLKEIEFEDGFMSVWVKLFAAPAGSPTVTFNPGINNQTSAIIVVYAIADMGSPAGVKLLASSSGVASAVPAFTDSGFSAFSGYAVITGIGCMTNPPGMTQPTDYSIDVTRSEVLPDTGLVVASGLLVTNQEWSAAPSNWAHCALVLNHLTVGGGIELEDPIIVDDPAIGQISYGFSSNFGEITVLGGGPATQIYRMRGLLDSTGEYVYWNTDIVDSTGATYPPGGSLSDVVVTSRFIPD